MSCVFSFEWFWYWSTSCAIKKCFLRYRCWFITLLLFLCMSAVFQTKKMETEEAKVNGGEEGERGGERMFTLKKWNAVAMWSWDVECDTCAICRVQVKFLHNDVCCLLFITVVQVMDACLRCQSETKVDCRGGKDCVVVWGECNHSFHQVTLI